MSSSAAVRCITSTALTSNGSSTPPSAASPPGGWFLFVDIIREEDQSRAAYLHSYIEFMTANWTELPGDHFAEARAHIEAHDYPESLPTLETMARAAGFHSVEPISRHGHHQVMLFTMPAVGAPQSFCGSTGP